MSHSPICVSVPDVAPTRPLKHRASVRQPLLLKARHDRGVQQVLRPRHGGELELLPGGSCDHTCVPPLPLKLLLLSLEGNVLLRSNVTSGALEEKIPMYCRDKSSLQSARGCVG